MFKSGALGLIGLVGVLYSGLGWLSALRDALITVFELPAREQPNFVMGKVRDLITLAIIGVVLLVAVAFTGLVSGFSGDLLEWAGLGTQLGWLVQVLVVVLGEFGRTPKISPVGPGREHWADAGCALFYGGGALEGALRLG